MQNPITNRRTEATLTELTSGNNRTPHPKWPGLQAYLTTIEHTTPEGAAHFARASQTSVFGERSVSHLYSEVGQWGPGFGGRWAKL